METLRETLSSVLLAALGVHTQQGAERDFTKGKPRISCFAGHRLHAAFVLIIFGVVQGVLHSCRAVTWAASQP